MRSEGGYGFPAHETLIVTGAGSGIGREIALEALRLGLRVSAWDRSTVALNGLEREATSEPGALLALTVDVTDLQAVQLAMDRTAQQIGGPKYLVNNAGPSEKEELTFQEGLMAAVGGARIVTGCWLQLESSRGGSVVNVASVQGAILGSSGTDWYAAAKAAIVGYTRHLATQRPNNVRANAVAPGIIDTPRTASYLATRHGQDALSRLPMRRAGTPSEVSSAVLFLLSPAAAYVNGVTLPVDGGYVVAM